MKPPINITVNATPQVLAHVSDSRWRAFVNEADDELEIFLTGTIGDDTVGSDAATVAKMLSANPQKRVRMRINSFGGLAYDGLAIHNALAMHPAPTTAIIDGVAASAASLAAIGADRVIMYDNATYHIHEGLAMAYGHIADLENTIEWLKAFNDAAIASYAAKTGRRHETIAKALLGERGDGTIYSAKQALDMHFVDEVVTAKSKKPTSESQGTAVSTAKQWLHQRVRLARLSSSMY